MVNLGSGEVYMISENGEKISLGNTLRPIEIIDETDDLSDPAVIWIKDNPALSLTLSHDLIIKPRSILKFLGLPYSNNYRKMHGGIMDRKLPIERRSKRGKKRKTVSRKTKPDRKS